jgi:hypothetical protein
LASPALAPPDDININIDFGIRTQEGVYIRAKQTDSNWRPLLPVIENFSLDILGDIAITPNDACLSG